MEVSSMRTQKHNKAHSSLDHDVQAKINSIPSIVLVIIFVINKFQTFRVISDMQNPTVQVCHSGTGLKETRWSFLNVERNIGREQASTQRDNIRQTL